MEHFIIKFSLNFLKVIVEIAPSVCEFFHDVHSLFSVSVLKFERLRIDNWRKSQLQRSFDNRIRWGIWD